MSLPALGLAAKGAPCYSQSAGDGCRQQCHPCCPDTRLPVGEGSRAGRGVRRGQELLACALDTCPNPCNSSAATHPALPSLAVGGGHMVFRPLLLSSVLVSGLCSHRPGWGRAGWKELPMELREAGSAGSWRLERAPIKLLGAGGGPGQHRAHKLAPREQLHDRCDGAVHKGGGSSHSSPRSLREVWKGQGKGVHTPQWCTSPSPPPPQAAAAHSCHKGRQARVQQCQPSPQSGGDRGSSSTLPSPWEKPRRDPQSRRWLKRRPRGAQSSRGVQAALSRCFMSLSQRPCPLTW